MKAESPLPRRSETSSAELPPGMTPDVAARAFAALMTPDKSTLIGYPAANNGPDRWSTGPAMDAQVQGAYEKLYNTQRALAALRERGTTQSGELHQQQLSEALKMVAIAQAEVERVQKAQADFEEKKSSLPPEQRAALEADISALEAAQRRFEDQKRGRIKDASAEDAATQRAATN